MALEVAVAPVSENGEGARRTFDLLRCHRDRDHLTVCMAGRVDRASPELPGTEVRNGWRLYSSDICVETMDAWSEWLLARGIRKGDRVALGGPNSPAWFLLDLAIQQAGGVTVPIHRRLSSGGLRHILEESECRLFFAEPALLEEAATMEPALPRLRGMHALDVLGAPEGANRFAGERPTAWEGSGLSGESAGDVLAARRDELEGRDVATIIYTSGTTGTPKGVVLTHRNLVSNVRAITRAVPLAPGGRALSFLPLAHSFERLVAYGYLATGTSIYFLDEIEDLARELPTVAPHYMTSVPRLLEKLYEALLNRGRQLSGLRRRLFERALAFGLSYEESGDSSWRQRIEHAVARRALFAPWREALGSDLELVLSGGARLEPRLARLFTAAGMTVVEGYGLTETSTFVTANGSRAGERRAGTVGRPVPGVEVRIADDGEVLVRGPNVMRGYLGRPDLTREAIDPRGWFHTGDLGTVDADGFLSITGRKKDLFKLSGGEYVAPEALEARYRRSPLIEHIMIVGEGRKHIAALVVPNFAELVERCRRSGVTPGSREEMARGAEARRLLADELDALGQGLPRAETIERFEILPEEWSVENGELSPTLKTRRHVVARRHADAIERCYAGESSPAVEPA